MYFERRILQPIYSTLVMKKFIFSSIFFFSLALGFGQENQDNDKWKFLVEPYLIFPNMSGEVGIRNLPSVEVDASPGDIFSNLKFGGMLYLEAQSDKWAITSDLLYMDLGEEATPSVVINSGRASAQQFMWEAAGLYRLAPYLEVGLGGRLNSLNAGIDITRNTIGGGTEALSGSVSQTWYDPVIITRVTADVDDKWLFAFRGDFGGFGVGSAFTWQAQGDVGYRFSKLFHTSLGYRILGMDYDKGSNEDRFRYNVNTFGAVLRFGFTF
jgi:hypothetical protein